MLCCRETPEISGVHCGNTAEGPVPRHTPLEDAQSSVQTTTSSLFEPPSPLLLGDTPSRLSKRGSGTAGHQHSGIPLVNKGRSVL